MNDGLHVDGMRHSAADPNVLQDRIAQVQGDIGVNGSGSLHDGQTRIFAQHQNGVGGEGIDGDIGTVLAQFERTGGGVGNHFEFHSLQLGRSAQ